MLFNNMTNNFYILLFSILIIEITQQCDSPPNKWQDADASWLSKQIYNGVNTMDTDSGSIWKQKYTGECYVVIRGTHSLADFMVDAQVAEFYDNEVGIYVHLGVRKRTDFILNDIGDRLKVCNNDIIITGHSLGAAVAHYLFLRYVYYHYYSWDLKDKAKKFKAVMFGAPQLLSRPNDQVLKNQEYCINWYKYGRRCCHGTNK